MRVALLIAVFIVLLLIAFLTVDFSEQDHDTVQVKTVQQWGRVSPPYVIDEAMFPPPARARTAPTRRTVHALSAGNHPCGPAYDLPPCYVMMRESRGDINAYNPTGCGGRGCRGKWQCDPRTCSGTGTEEQQDAEARALWNHGAGCAHWSACG